MKVICDFFAKNLTNIAPQEPYFPDISTSVFPIQSNKNLFETPGFDSVQSIQQNSNKVLIQISTNI